MQIVYHIHFLNVNKTKSGPLSDPLVLALPIFPGRRQPSIVGRNELNYRVRNGNGWTLILINTNYLILKKEFGDPYRIRTDVNGVRGRCLNHLTNGPYLLSFLRAAPSKPNNVTNSCVQAACINRRSSPRAISTGQLHTLLHFHLRPIYQVVFLGPYS